ncbi:MAG: zinc-dependent alcohol dehydrogenase family protein [Alphaproteobacteria bacterium]|nr:zinc-dependent alcohol dehydrogenase family protein [Alphaproteobacteria bacterium]
MRMRAAVLSQQGLPRPYAESRPIAIEEVELDGPGPGEVLVEIGGAGLCHSDLSTIENLRPRKMPTVPGHEAAGIVRELGAGVRGLKRDDHVAMVFVSSCRECRYCQGGRPNLCESSWGARTEGTLVSGARRLRRLDGSPLHHYSGLSTFAQYAVVSASSLVSIPKEVPFTVAAAFGCAVVTGVGAVFNTAETRPGTPLAVVGLGGVGLSALLGAVAAGANPIVAVDVSEAKLALARELGATHAVNARAADALAQVKDITGGGVDVAIETAGTIPAMETAYALCARGGITVSAGLPAPTSSFAYRHAALVSDERQIRGSYMGSCVPGRDIPRFMGLYLAGRLPIERLFSGALRLEEINQGFDRLAEGTVVRQVLTPNAA